MLYEKVQRGTFITRPNRFIAQVEIDGQVEIVHVKNTGRFKELLVTGADVYVNRSDNPKRATRFDLIAVFKGDRLVNIDSQAPNKVFLDYLRSGRYLEGITRVQPEAKHGGSRFDFYVEAGQRRIFIEVKGVTLEENGVALFPDAPTLRGVKHLNELATCLKDGYEAQVVFVIQMRGIRYFTPNNQTHPAFGEAMAAARDAGVIVSAFDCTVTETGLEIRNSVPVSV